MKLPNRENAYIPASKLKGYLLSETHAAGRSKAKFLRSLGFDDANIELLERGLFAIAQTQEVSAESSSPHGTKYIIEGSLQTPSGKTVKLRTVWIIDKDHDQPRFVTAIPN